MTTTRSRRRAFTAVEIAMVASVIAIIALLILPLYRSRTTEARLVGAQDEMASLAKAMLLVEADIARAVPLQALDNRSSQTTGEPLADIPYSERAPEYTWNGLELEESAIDRQWKGPYISYNKSTTMGEIRSLQPWLVVENGGPLYYEDPISPPAGSTNNAADALADRFPLDPFGNPYIFFSTGIYPHPSAFASSIYNSPYNQVWSLGPDGLPGDAPTFGSAGDYYPTPIGRLSETVGDDIRYRF
ncbi:MAG: hypothetical protein RLY93_15965 [Sumerlaeia bacterium]